MSLFENALFFGNWTYHVCLVTWPPLDAWEAGKCSIYPQCPRTLIKIESAVTIEEGENGYQILGHNQILCHKNHRVISKYQKFSKANNPIVDSLIECNFKTKRNEIKESYSLSSSLMHKDKSQPWLEGTEKWGLGPDMSGQEKECGFQRD